MTFRLLAVILVAISGKDGSKKERLQGENDRRHSTDCLAYSRLRIDGW
jgi:hypothetical protein